MGIPWGTRVLCRRYPQYLRCTYHLPDHRVTLRHEAAERSSLVDQGIQSCNSGPDFNTKLARRCEDEVWGLSRCFDRAGPGPRGSCDCGCGDKDSSVQGPCIKIGVLSRVRV